VRPGNLSRKSSPTVIAASRLFREALGELDDLGSQPRRSPGTSIWALRPHTRS
jgi:hypothetical protein